MTGLGLFGRAVRFQIGPPGGVGLEHSGLRVGFKVEHKASKHPSSATIRIWNPSPATIGLLNVPLAVIRLFAGYEPMPQLVFQGEPVKGGVNLRVQGPDRVLEVDAADGGRAFVETFLQLSFTTPTTFGQVLAVVLAQTLWARGYIDPSIEAVQLPHGVALIGRPGEVMDRLAAAALPLGADWFVRDGALYVVGKGQTTPEVAPLISSTTGNLIGSPTATKDGVKVRALIDATMRPGRAFVVDSMSVKGTYIAKDVTFTGDSGYDRDFYMDLAGTPPGAP